MLRTTYRKLLAPHLAWGLTLATIGVASPARANPNIVEPSVSGEVSDIAGGARGAFATTDFTTEVAQLWFTDGTTGNTNAVQTFMAQVGQSPANLTILLTTSAGVYFNETGGAAPLFFSDGGASAASLGVSPSFAFGTLPNGISFFSSQTGAGGTMATALIQSDGTLSGTIQLSTVPALSALASTFAIVGNDAYFAVVGDDTTEFDNTLSKTDGTTFTPVFSSSTENVAGLAGCNGKLFFVTTPESGSGAETLYVVSGTAAPAQIGSFSQVTNMACGDPFLFFVASAAGDGTDVEPWTSDGTSGGTTMLVDIAPSGGAFPETSIVAGGGFAYFAADDGVHGNEPWVTDGTSGGTHLLVDLLTGSGSSDPTFLALVDGYAVATTVENDVEAGLYALTPSSTTGTTNLLSMFTAEGFGLPGSASLGTKLLWQSPAGALIVWDLAEPVTTVDAGGGSTGFDAGSADGGGGLDGASPESGIFVDGATGDANLGSDAQGGEGAPDATHSDASSGSSTPHDAGAGGTKRGDAQTADAAGTAASTGSGGCSCQVVSGHGFRASDAPAPWLLVGLIGAVAARRRTQPSSATRRRA